MKIVNATVLALSMAGVSACSVLPFSGSQRDAGSSVIHPPADQGGVQVRLSKRGNMESYVVGGTRYHTLKSADGYSARGLASWYGPNFHGRDTSNGEVYDMYRLSAAHRALPLPTYARVTHLENGKSVIVKINDRGPFSGDRLIDLSFAAALKLGMVNEGTAMVDIQALSASELLAMTGPDNTMNIDFYDPIAESKQPADGELVTVAAVYNDQNTVPDTLDDIADTDAMAQTVAHAKEPLAEPKPNLSTPPQRGDVEVPSIVVPADEAVTEDGYETGDSINLESLIESAAKAVEPVQKETVYYVQAGVFPSADDAERAAVDVVLELPNESVNIKPLKNSDSYRVTIGPVLQAAHASDISTTLDSAGVDNFTVKVEE